MTDRLSPIFALTTAERASARHYTPAYSGLVEILFDKHGNLPCDPPDICTTCSLFSAQRPDETRPEWIARIVAGGTP